jgi:hypothetical protein
LGQDWWYCSREEDQKKNRLGHSLDKAAERQNSEIKLEEFKHGHITLERKNSHSIRVKVAYRIEYNHIWIRPRSFLL